MGMSVTISAASADDAEHILKLQYLCFQSEAELYGDYSIEPLTQPLDDLKAEIARGHALVARLGNEVVASVRGEVDETGTARIGKLIVHPRLRGHGLGGRLLDAIEQHFARDAEAAAKRFRLFTGNRSEGNLRLYRRKGYETVSTRQVGPSVTVVTLEKAA
ncbi:MULTISPECIES: GNAT family N-acetyltransferase [Streptomyces]|uniref:Acetyltransferase n=2 Tax=Streptomyces TaxID=1883 RepID=A0A1Y2NZK1_STRFR|nr:MULTISPECIES: GNAT family N-acetyltransferase [Streptomyces]AOT58005.1 putative acetyltransferase [Streptomyces rubrolavendulae]KAF0649171.1 acetyltransferase [Streptomyces fradiae ATCC 10745 = DSM 40063]OSY52946.1 putative acetyltransferase [Streptomyces fradiae ATCC 10745 = DSM 40063]QEV11347.1 GNAT family N-acetyltransferase [Streptomyces fradiae ATCC 10745 = DSM 40063]UQS28957.1 GNAT family N-acetyltransferase [Streptomyces fradiae]